MAKKKDVKLLPIEDYAKMNAADIRKAAKEVVGEARKVANKLLKSDKLTGHYSHAIEGARKTKAKDQVGLFDLRGKNRNQMLREIKRAKTFLEARTSTIEGVYQVEKETHEKVQNALGWEVDRTRMNRMWGIYGKIKEENKWIADAQVKYQVVEQVLNYMDQGYTASEIEGMFDQIRDQLQGMDHGEEDTGEGWFDISE